MYKTTTHFEIEFPEARKATVGAFGRSFMEMLGHVYLEWEHTPRDRIPYWDLKIVDLAVKAMEVFNKDRDLYWKAREYNVHVRTLIRRGKNAFHQGGQDKVRVKT